MKQLRDVHKVCSFTQTFGQYLLVLFLQNKQQTDEMLWWCSEDTYGRAFE